MFVSVFWDDVDLSIIYKVRPEESFVLNFVTKDIADVNVDGYDLIISNPQYKNILGYKELDASVLDWEDKIALVDESSESFTATKYTTVHL
jgi:hypothetical protein